MSNSNSEPISKRLPDAAAEGDIEVVRAALGETPSATQDDLNEALWVAAAQGRYDTVKLLLEHGAHPDAPTDSKWGQPAKWAVEKGHHDVVHLLLDHGSDLSKNLDDSDMNAAGYALHSDNEELTNRIYLHGGRPNIYAYVRANKLVVLAELLDYCPDAPCKRPDGNGTVLEVIRGDAAWLGNADAMKMVLNIRPEMKGNGLIIHAIASHNRIFPAKDYLRIFQMLLDHAPEQTDDPDFLPLHRLARKRRIEGRLDFAVLFLDRGVDVNRVDPENGQTALYVAVEHEQCELVELLLERGADVSIRSRELRKTPLQVAERAGFSEIIEVLQRSST